MNINLAIKEKRLMDVTLFSNEPRKIIYTGVCLIANENIWLILQYNWDLKKFDGYSVFRTENIDFFEVYKNTYYDGSSDLDYWLNLIDTNKCTDFYSTLNYISNKFKLIAFFLKYLLTNLF